MKCGPDECPIVAFSDLTPAEQRVERKRIAKKMTDQGFTLEQIAKQLGVGKSTISTDLANFPETGKSKPAKTASNPKGAGRPKGGNNTLPKKSARHHTMIELSDQGKNAGEIASEVGTTERQVHQVLLRERVKRIAENAIDPTTLAPSAQERLEAVVRSHKRELDAEFESRVLEECRRRLNEMILPAYTKQLEELERSITSRKGIMDRISYRKILACLHPDRVSDPVLKKRYEEAFRLFTEIEKRLLDEKQSPTEFRKMPRTYEELMAMKAKMQAQRKAQRSTGKSVAQ